MPKRDNRRTVKVPSKNKVIKKHTIKKNAIKENLFTRPTKTDFTKHFK